MGSSDLCGLCNPSTGRIHCSPCLSGLRRCYGCCAGSRFRQASSNEIFAIGVTFWVVLQTFAIAHARGHGLVSLPSRYTEILAIGLLANLWLTLNMLRQPLRSGIVMFLEAVAAGLGIVLVVMTWGRSEAILWICNTVTL